MLALLFAFPLGVGVYLSLFNTSLTSLSGGDFIGDIIFLMLVEKG